MSWFCVYEGMTSDPKWLPIAKRSGANLPTVIAIWVALLDCANQSEERGSIYGFDAEAIDMLYGLEDGTCERVIGAMQDKGLIEDGKISKWEKRQFNTSGANQQKAVNPSTERSRKSRDKKRQEQNAAMQRDAMPCNGNATSATDCNAAATTATPCNASATDCNEVQQNATPLKDIIYNKKENILNTPPLPPTGGSGESVQSPQPRSIPSRQEIPQLPSMEPDLEFVQLRECWNRSVVPEGEQAGFIAYLAVKKARKWPGLVAIQRDVMERKTSGYWRRGYEPGLEKYLRELGWTAPKENPRAAAQSASIKSFTELQDEADARLREQRKRRAIEYDRRKAEEEGREYVCNE